MNYKVSCTEASGIRDCTFVAMGHSLEEVAAELREHGLTNHSEVLKALTEQEWATIASNIERRVTEQKAEASN